MIATKRLLTAAVLATAFAAGSSSVHACSCTGPATFEQSFASSKQIFRGTVVEVLGAEPEHLYHVWARIVVEQSWKGAPPETVAVLTAQNEAACGFNFVPGNVYLVYATNYFPEDVVYTHLCTRSHETWAGDPDIGLLNEITPALGHTWGALKLLYR